MRTQKKSKTSFPTESDAAWLIFPGVGEGGTAHVWLRCTDQRNNRFIWGSLAKNTTDTRQGLISPEVFCKFSDFPPHNFCILFKRLNTLCHRWVYQPASFPLPPYPLLPNKGGISKNKRKTTALDLLICAT